jgi:hypothetical protein
MFHIQSPLVIPQQRAPSRAGSLLLQGTMILFFEVTMFLFLQGTFAPAHHWFIIRTYGKAHKMRRIILPIVLMLGFLAGCTTTERYEASLDPWLGKTERELVMGWGVPDKQYQLDEHTKMISYIAYDAVDYPGSMTSCFGMGGSRLLLNNCVGDYPTRQTFYCETIFTVVNGRVNRWGHKGNNCRR